MSNAIEKISEEEKQNILNIVEIYEKTLRISEHNWKFMFDVYTSKFRISKYNDFKQNCSNCRMKVLAKFREFVTKWRE